jgi:hypothetical protein
MDRSPADLERSRDQLANPLARTLGVELSGMMLKMNEADGLLQLR